MPHPIGGRCEIHPTGDLYMGEPRFRHVDETPWEEVRTQQHGDRRAVVREKWLDFTPGFLSLYAEWDPGMIVRRHGHNSNHVVFVLEGEMTCGEEVCGPGQHISLDQGDTFGPFVAGPDGVRLFEVMMGDPRSFGSDQAEFERLLDEHGAVELPHPNYELPDWLQD